LVVVCYLTNHPLEEVKMYINKNIVTEQSFLSKFQYISSVTGTPSERGQDGKRIFTRRLFGIWGLFTGIVYKNLQEFTSMLIKLGLAATEKEAIEFLHCLCGKNFVYEFVWSYYPGGVDLKYQKAFFTEKIITPQGQALYRFTKVRLGDINA